jgi:hypothetical protein
MLVLVSSVGAGEAEQVEFEASDGTRLSGLAVGKGETGLLLCHGRGYVTGGKSFEREYQHFAAQGIACLAINFRGYPAKAPPMPTNLDRDVLAGFQALAERGAKRIVVLGSSMGGFAVLQAIDELSRRPQYAGMVILSAYHAEACRGVGGPKLFFVSQDDRDFYARTVVTCIKAASPKQLVVFKLGGHGQTLFKTHRQEVLDRISLFLREAGNSNP